MNLKNTKVMQPKLTALRSNTLSPQSTTEKPLVALKNTCSVAQKPIYKFHQKGADAEALVQSYFLSRGWSVFSQRAKLEGVEVDLIVEKAGRRVLLEVKLLDHSWRAFERVGTKQIQRLKYVLFGMRKHVLKDNDLSLRIEGFVVFVLPNAKLHFISLDEII